MKQSNKEELERCKKDPAYFVEKYVKVKNQKGEVTEISKDDINKIREYFKHFNKQKCEHYRREKFYRKYNHKLEKRKSRYSVIGNLLAKERSSRKCLKRRFKQRCQMFPSAGVVLLNSTKSGLSTFHTYYQKARSLAFDSVGIISGSAASNVIENGKPPIDLTRSLPPNLPNIND